jgi:hypothetical protein
MLRKNANFDLNVQPIIEESEAEPLPEMSHFLLRVQAMVVNHSAV